MHRAKALVHKKIAYSQLGGMLADLVDEDVVTRRHTIHEKVTGIIRRTYTKHIRTNRRDKLNVNIAVSVAR